MFSPGETIPVTAAYLVHHAGHRHDHDVNATEGATFPFCRQCGEAVRFVLLDSSVFKAHASLASDPDFSNAASVGN